MPPAVLQPNAFVTLEQAKAVLLIRGSDRDDLLTDAINRISDYVENYCQRGFKKRTLTAVRLKAQYSPKLYLPVDPIDVTEPVEVQLDQVALSVWRSDEDGDPAEYDVMVGADVPGEPTFLFRADGWMGATAFPIRLTITAGADPIRGDVLDAYYTILDVAWREQLTKTQDLQQLSGAAPSGSFTLRESLIPMRAKYTLDMYRSAGRVGGGFDAVAMRGAVFSRPPGPGPSPGGGAPVDAQYVTLAADPTLTNERVLAAGSNITLTDNGPGQSLVIAATGGAGGGAPVDAQYITAAPDPTLTAERVIASTPTVTWDLGFTGEARAAVPDNAITFAKIQDVPASRLLGRGAAGGAGDPEELTVGSGLSLTGTTLSATPPAAAPVGAQYVTLGADPTLTAERVLTAGSNITLTDNGPGGTLLIAATAPAPQPAAPPDALYVTLATDPTLTAERVLTAGANITLTDGGPGGALTIAAAGGGGGAPTTASFITAVAEAALGNERVLTAGANITLTDGGPGGPMTIAAAGGSSGGGAPVGAEYLTAAPDPTLTAERVITPTPTVTWDLTVAGQAQANVPDNAITFGKIQDVAASRLLGRGSAGPGDPQELTVGSGLNLTGTTLSAPPPAAAPVGAEYLVGAADATLSAERVVTDTPTVAWDLTAGGQAKANVPNDSITWGKIQNISAASRLLGRGSAAGPGDTEELTIGSGLTLTGTTLAATAAAPPTASYITAVAEAGLTNERVLAAGTGITLNDGGAGGAMTINATPPPAAAPLDPQYVTLAPHAGLPNERVLTAGANVTLTDGGPGGALTIAAAGGGGGPSDLRVLKVTADVTVNNTIVLAPVTGLELAVLPGEKWFVEYDIQANSALAPDHRWGFINPPNTTIYWGQFATIAGAFHFNTPAGTAHIAPIMQDGFLANEGNAATDCLFHFRAFIHVGDTGGQVTFAFAQNTATATPTIVRAGSSGLARHVL